MTDAAELPEAVRGLRRVVVERRQGSKVRDWVAVEAPLELRLDGQPFLVTMRTPGADRELAAGLLYSEGVIHQAEDLAAVERGSDPGHPDHGNILHIRLAPEAGDRWQRLGRARREVAAYAACGLCGKGKLADLEQSLPRIEPWRPPFDLVRRLPEGLRREQPLFATTGGIHGAGLFDAEGGLICCREDIGRHNAVDKVLGHCLLDGRLPPGRSLLVTSGRASFEIVQKAAMAAIPAVVAVGAASSLAVELARERGMELFSFVRPGHGNRHL